jgi:hypothetical protein
MKVLLLSSWLLAGAASAQTAFDTYAVLKMRCQVAPGPRLTACRGTQAGGADPQRQQGLVYDTEHTPPNLPANTAVGSTVERDVRLMRTTRPIALPLVH